MMTTTLTDETMDIQVLEERWLLLVQKEHPRLHEAALRCYVEHDATPTAAALAEALGAGADGEGWRRALMALRLPPCHYAALCEAQDAVAQADMQWQNYQHEVRETRDRVAAIDDELVKLATYATLGEAEKAEVAERVQDLRAERRDVEVYQQTHLPRVGATLDQEKGQNEGDPRRRVYGAPGGQERACGRGPGAVGARTPRGPGGGRIGTGAAGVYALPGCGVEGARRGAGQVAVRAGVSQRAGCAGDPCRVGGHHGYQQLDDEFGHPLRCLRAFCTARVPFGLGYDPGMVEALQAETRAMLLGEKVEEVRQLLTQAQPKEGRRKKLCDSHSLTQSERAEQNGVSVWTQHRLDYLATHAPDLLPAVEDGTLSAHRVPAKVQHRQDLDQRQHQPGLATRIAPEAAVGIIVPTGQGAQARAT